MRHTFDWNGARITLDSLTVRDRNHKTIIADILIRKLGGTDPDLATNYDVLTFAEYVVSVKAVEGEFPVPVMDATANADALVSALDAWLSLPEDFLDAYVTAKAMTRIMGNPVPVEKKAEPTTEST